MKTSYLSLLLLLGSFTANAQIIQSMGSSNVPVNWRPTLAIETLLLDVNGDGINDVSFYSEDRPSTGQGIPSFTYFTTSIPANNGMEIAIDSSEFDSIHRFVAGDRIGRGLIWKNAGGGYLAYTVTGNGGTGGRGFFRFGQDGFIAIRQRLGSQMRYWWFYITPRTAPGGEWVSYYAGTTLALATGAAAQAAPPVLAFPNPTTSSWKLSGPAAYQLFDSRGQLVSSSRAIPATTVAAENIPAGIYYLLTTSPSGAVSRGKLVKQ